MEPLEPGPSTSLVLTSPHSRKRRGAAAFLVLLLQLVLVGLVPAADARASAADTGTLAGVHMEKPGTHHPVHDAADCAFCIALQLGASPAPAAAPPAMGVARRLAAPRARPESHSPTIRTSRIARAPPIAG